MATTEPAPLTLRRLEDHLWQAADLFRNKVSNQRVTDGAPDPAEWEDNHATTDAETAPATPPRPSAPGGKPGRFPRGTFALAVASSDNKKIGKAATTYAAQTAALGFARLRSSKRGKGAQGRVRLHAEQDHPGSRTARSSRCRRQRPRGGKLASSLSLRSGHRLAESEAVAAARGEAASV